MVDFTGTFWGEEKHSDEETQEGEVKKPAISPVTIWIGVFPGSTSATAAHDAAQDVLALLRDYQITNIDVDFRESFYIREAGPQLLRPVHDMNPLYDVISPLTPALGLPISSTTRLNAQGTMALYLAEGGDSDKLLGLTCRHVLVGPKEPNVDFVRHLSGRPNDVILLGGKRAFKSFLETIQARIGRYAFSTDYLRRQIEAYEKKEGNDTDDAEKFGKYQVKTQALLEKEEKAIEKLGAFFDQVNKDWKEPENRILGPVLCSPAIHLGVSEHRFTEDWGIFQVDRAQLGDGFQGNKIDMGAF